MKGKLVLVAALSAFVPGVSPGDALAGGNADVQRTACPCRHDKGPRGEVRVMTDSELGVLLARIGRQGFADAKLDMVEVASLGCRYTCAQCVRIMSLFAFSSEKLEALRFMSPRIVDAWNGYDIIRTFAFDSDRERAARILKDGGER